jgi:acyl-CoA reductase-like NAD-dependent aldehyde dehydrogenase
MDGKIIEGSSGLDLMEKEYGICDTVDEAVKEAQNAFTYYQTTTFTLRKNIIADIRTLLAKHKEELARMAVAETGLGRVEDKIAKNTLVIEKTPGMEIRDARPQPIFPGDYGLTFIGGVPFGVIGSVTPSTNPAATIINNSITMLSAGNTVVFNTHPGAKGVSNMAAALVNKAVRQAGSKCNLVFSLRNPTIESSQQLMKHPDIRLLVVTGGPDVVKAAMASGKKVIAAGPGNPPVVVDETANIEQAAQKIVQGASFDNNILCIAEKEVFIVETVAEQLKQQMCRHRAYELSRDELMKVEKIIFTEKNDLKVMNKKYIGKNAEIIAQDAGVSIPAEIRLLFAETAFQHPLVQHEQLMPVLPIVRIKDWREGVDLAIKAEHNFNHTSIMHSTNIERLITMARLMNTVIFVENGHSLSGLGFEGEGHTTMTVAGPTGEGITGPWSFVRQRRYVLINSFRGNISTFSHY